MNEAKLSSSNTTSSNIVLKEQLWHFAADAKGKQNREAQAVPASTFALPALPLNQRNFCTPLFCRATTCKEAGACHGLRVTNLNMIYLF